MAGVQKPSCHYCFNLVELAKDTGPLGQLLRANPDYQRMLPAADKLAEQTLEQQIKQADPKRFPFPDPWQVLLESPGVPPFQKKVFRSAQSQIIALLHLASIARGESTLHTRWFDKMCEAGTRHKFVRAAKKVGNARAAYQLFEALIQSPGVAPPFREWGQQRIRESQKERQKRGKGKHFVPLPRGIEIRNRYKLASALVDWWVRGPNGAPGLMFFRNEAMTEFLKTFLKQQNLTPATVKKIRQQLGLIPVGSKKHFVWHYKITALDTRKSRSVGYQRNGKTAFSGVLEG